MGLEGKLVYLKDESLVASIAKVGTSSFMHFSNVYKLLFQLTARWKREAALAKRLVGQTTEQERCPGRL